MNKEIKYLKYFIVFFIIGLTIIIGGTLLFNIKKGFQSVNELAIAEGKASYNKDLLYRRWASMHGGVYVPITDTTPPNPYLSHIPDRDITTEKGKKLTLINPAYMTRQVFTIGETQNEVKGHITSLNPIRKENKPDDWEINALQLFEKGELEYSIIEKINGNEYMRFMHAMKVEQSCLKCHSQQGYKVGDIRGGISVSVPMEKYKEIAISHSKKQTIVFLLIYIVILFLGIFGYKRFLLELKKRLSIQNELIESGKVLKMQNKEYAALNEELITAKEKAEESEEKFKAAFYTSPDAVSISTLNGKYVEINEGFTRISGYTETEVLGKTASEINIWAVPEDRNTFVETLKKNNYIENFECLFRAKNGTIIPALVSAQIITFKNEPFILAVTRNITERKKYEAELINSKEKAEESERKFRVLFESLPIGVTLADKNGQIITSNSAAEKILGLTKEDQLQRSIDGNEWSIIRHDRTLMPPKEYASVRALNEQRPINNIEMGIDKGINKVTWINVNAAPIKDNGVVISYEDITERKRAEEDVIISKERFVLAMNAAKDGLYDWNLVTNEIYYSPGWKSMLGYKDEELPNDFSVWEKLTEPHDVQKSWKLQQQLINKQRDRFEMEFKMKHKDGHWVDILSRADAVFNEAGKAIRMVGTHIDISERKRAQEKIQLAEENLKNTFNVSPSIISKVNLNTGYFLEASPAVTRILGYTAKEFTSKPIWEFIHPDDKGKTDVAVETHISGNDITYFENRYLCKDGSYKWMAWHGRHGEKDGIVTTIGSDITKRKQAEIELIKAKEKAEESDRLKSAFLANMSHEIRTPMNGILGFSNLLNEPGLESEEQQAYIKIIQKSGARMLNILSEIVEISKIESGAVDLQIRQLNINKKMESVYELSKPDATVKSINLSLKNNLRLREPILNTDEAKLDSILTNLVKNAIKYTDEGSIEFGYNPKEIDGRNLLEFYVKDTGVGIENHRQDAIFDRFIQANIEDVEARQGAGLGLTIVKSYVELLGGKVWVESEMGIGSTFYFTLPYNTNPKQKSVDKNDLPSKKVSNQINPELSELKILIADDDETSLIYLSTIIKDITNNVLVASSGIETVKICQSNSDINLVLMDIQMPEMNGYEATQQIRKFNKEVIIVAQTAFAMAGDRQKSIAVGCNDYISKPIKKGELVALIQKYFEK